MIEDMLYRLQGMAKKDENLRARFLATRNEAEPLRAFCEICRSLGFEIYEMDVISAGEDMYAQMKRSTNGGGENSPMLEGEDDYYEMFLAAIE